MKKIWYFLFLVLVLYFANKIMVYLEYRNVPIGLMPKDKKAIVVGATSGMGRQVAKILAKKGYEVGLIGRRLHRLRSLEDEIDAKTYIKQIDVSQVEQAKKQLEELINQMGRLDLMVISISALVDIGCKVSTSKMRWEQVKKLIDVDMVGFWVAAHVAIKQFEKQGYGHLVGVSSINKCKGSPISPEYSGAKSFVSTYLDGMRNRMIINKLPIFVTEVIPGPVNVERQNYNEIEGIFWVATSQEAAEQIYQAIESKKEKAYITKRWGIIAGLLSVMPDWLYRRLDG